MRTTTLVSSSLLLGALTLAACNATTLQPNRQIEVPAKVAQSAPLLGIDAEHYRLELVLDPIARAIEGTARVRFSAVADELATVTFDLEALKVRSVIDRAGRELAYFQKNGGLTVVLAEPVVNGSYEELTIHYGGTPKKGLWFVAEREGMATQVFTQGECEDSRWWFPCIDVPSDRATSELIVTMPAGWVATAAGERVDRAESAGSVTEHWRMATPHPTYLTTLVAGDFAVIEDEWEGLPLTYLAAPELASLVPASFAETGPVLGFMSNLTGLRYPYTKYSQACVAGFPFGGMENISATTMTETCLSNETTRKDGDSVGLIAHEAAHQWFGDLLTCNTWDHIWLNEGFATYATQLYFEATRGNDEFRMRWFDTLTDYLSKDVGADRRPTVHGVYRDPIDLFFTGHAYGGGAVRLHYLRFVLGDAAFFEGLRTYVADNQGRGVTTYDFQVAMEKASGQDLDGFFDQWLYGEGYPELKVSWRWKGGGVELTVEQTQSGISGTPTAFRLPVDVELRTAKGSVTHRIELNQRRQVFQLPSDARPDWVWFDEGGWLPARVERVKSIGEWMAIAASQDDAIARRLAVRALGAELGDPLPGDQEDFARAELVNRLRQDSSSWVRSEAATALGIDRSPEARLRLMAAASTDRNTHVRKAAFGALESWGKDLELAGFARIQYETAYSPRSMAAAAGLLAKSDPDGAFQWLVRALFAADSLHDELRADLLRVLVDVDNGRVASQLSQWANDPTAGSQARVAAVEGLAKVGKLNKQARQSLIDLLGSRDARLSRAVVTSLAEFDDALSRNALRQYYDRTVVPREKRAIEAAFGR